MKTLYIVAKESSAQQVPAQPLGYPLPTQILGDGRSAEMPDVGISIIVIAVSLTGFRYSYQQECVSW